MTINTTLPTTCQICHGGFEEFIEASDKMFATSDTFIYGLCKECGCLQELNPPARLDEHYPKNYYSLKQKPRKTIKSWRRGVKRRIILSHPECITKWIRFLISDNALYWAYRDCGLRLDHKLLDVGTGAGEHVVELRQAGLVHAVGIDPHIDGDITYNNTVLVWKCNLQSITDKFDFITFHHSLEHIPDQIGTINAAANLLNKGGKMLIRIPTVSSMAYEKYKSNWFQLDAPRHLFLHSHKSIQLLAQSAGMRMTKIWCDSNEHQFLISELHKQNKKIQLNHKEIRSAIKASFTNDDISRFKNLTSTANKNMQGDQICILLEK